MFNEAGGDQSSEDEYESRPYYEDIAEAYETDGLALIDRVGGKLKVNFDTNKSFSEGGTCAVRVSSACNLGGDPIPAKKDLPKGVRMLKDAEGNSYIYSAGEFAKYVSNRYGPPENIKSFDVISGKKGFIYFSSGHVDLFDGSDLVGNTGQGNDYLNRSSRVQFWQLPSRPSD